jgi:hypothetical protein
VSCEIVALPSVLLPCTYLRRENLEKIGKIAKLVFPLHTAIDDDAQ